MGSISIRWGDTLSSLASRFKTTVSALASANGISNPNLIIAGQALKVPGAGGGDSFSSGGTGGTSAPGGLPNLSGASGGGSSAIARAGYAAAMSMGGYNSQGLCATGVSRALATLGISVHGNGNQIDDNLPSDKFRQVNISLEEALKIPGCVLTWEHTSTSLGALYGHTAITAGDGHSSYSDFIENNTLAGAASRTGLKIFMPIT